MRDVDAGDAELAVELDQLCTRLHAQLGIEVGEGLIHQEDFRFADNGAAQGNTLALATRKLLRLAVQQLTQPKHLRDRLHTLADLIRGGARLGPPGEPPNRARQHAQPQSERHIIENAHMRVESVVLEHHGDVAVLGRDVVHYPVANQDLSLRDLLETRNHAQGRRLAASRGTNEHQELPVPDLEVHIVDGYDVLEPLGNIAQGNSCHQ